MRVAVAHPGKRDASRWRADLGGGRDQGKGVVQERVHLLARLLDAGLGREVRGRRGRVAGGRGAGGQEDVVGWGGGLRGLIRVRLEERDPELISPLKTRGLFSIKGNPFQAIALKKLRKLWRPRTLHFPLKTTTTHTHTSRC